MTLLAPINSERRPANGRHFASSRNLTGPSFRRRLCLSLLTLGLLLGAITVNGQQATKRVLILTGSDPNFPGFAIITRSIQSTLRNRSPARIEFIYELQQDLVDNSESKTSDEELIGYLKQKYAGKQIDLVLVMVASRFRVLAEKDPTLFRDIPKIFYEYDQEREDTNRLLGPDITGVWASLDRYRATLDFALAVNPAARKVVVITGGGSQDKIILERAQTEFRAYEDRAEFIYLIGEPVENLKRQLAALDRSSIVIFASFTRDKTGNSYNGPEVLSMIAPSSAAPIYGSAETLMGVGIIGGKLLDFEGTGKRIGEMALRVLAGEKPGRIPQETAPSVMTADWRELQRWGISEQSLPSGTIIRFKQPSFWEAYKWYAIGLMTAVIIEALLIAWLLFLRARRRQAEEENLRLARLANAEHKRLDEIVSNVPGIVWETVVEPETKVRKTTFVSDYVRKMLGYTAEEWLAASPGLGLRIMPEPDREQAERESEAVIANRREGVCQFRWQAKDGHIVWTESYLNPMSNENGEVIGLRGVTLDITARKAAEEALRAERALLEVVVQHLPSCVCLIRGTDLRLQMINPAYQAIAPGKEMIGKTLDELWPETGKNFSAICQHVLETGEPHQVTDELNTIRRMPGTSLESAYFTWSLHRVRLPGGEGWGLLNAGWETTERKQTEDALRESEERFGKAFRANPQPMTLTTVADGEYIYVNESFLSISGYTSDEVLGHTSLELRIWETLECRADFIRQLMERGSLVNVETKLRTKDGSFRLLLSSAERLDVGGVECLLIASSDITERMQAQQALQESEARFRNMADTAPVMIWVESDENLCTYVNQQWCDFTGLTMEQSLGTGWAECIHPEDRARCLETHCDAFERREPFHQEYRLRRADAVYHWIIASGAPRFSTKGVFRGYIGTCLDITDRKESEESLRLAHEEVSKLKTQLQEENVYLQEEIRLQQNFGEIIGESDALKYVLFKIEQVAPTDSTVLITGETGTGKELVADAIHQASTRADRPLVRVNCAALAASLIESELFGHEKGAFTGAVGNKVGRFELANGATIFLDEIGELPPESQGKLLRVIQEGEFERLGSSRTSKVDVRIIAATNRNLDLEVKKGLFREDLWYRLNVFPITVPPLRQRREDIPLLVEHFVSKFAKKLGKVITSVSPTTLKSLRDYSWRGNVRELANVIERAVINSQGSVLRISENFGLETIEELTLSTKTLEEIERDYILRVLEDRAWRIEGRHGAARLLGLNPSTLRTRMMKLGIHRQSFSASATTASRDDNGHALAGKRSDPGQDRNP